MLLEQSLTALEALALKGLRTVDPDHGTIHDYRNILHHVDRAQRALGAAYAAIGKADQALREIVTPR